MKFINESTNTMLLTGSDDGVVRVWANLDHEPKMLTSWRALEGLTGTKGSSLLLDFNQDTGVLVRKNQKSDYFFFLFNNFEISTLQGMLM